MIIKPFLHIEIEEVNSYLVASEITRDAVIIDAGGFDVSLLDFVNENKLNVRKLFITHEHYDHTGSVPYLFDNFPNLQLVALRFEHGKTVVKPVDGERFMLGDHIGYINHLPGHTEDMITIYLDGHLFTGDVLFAGSVGGTSSKENFKRQIEGIQSKLLIYPDETIIHPGHGSESTVGIERMFNPFLC